MTGILCAIEQEIAPFLGAILRTKKTETAMLAVHEGYMGKTPVALVRSGVCKVNAAMAAQLLITQFHVKRVIVSGTAGGMDKRLKIGDTVVAAEVVYHDVAGYILTKLPPYMAQPYFMADPGLLALCKKVLPAETHFGRMATGEAFISEEGRGPIMEKHAPLCVDMETAAVAHVCYMHQIPFIAVRSITDTEDDVKYGSFFEHVDMASRRSFDAVSKLLGVLE